MSSSYGHLICVWAWDAVSGGCVQVRVIHILPWWLWIWGGLILGTRWTPRCSPIFQVDGGPAWTGGGLTGSCPFCLKMVPVPSINSCMPSLSREELCSLPALTSWELMQVLLLWWWWSEKLEKQSHFFCVEMARNVANGCPTRRVPTKGRPSRRGAGEEECWLDELDCLRSPEWVIPPTQVQQ